MANSSIVSSYRCRDFLVLHALMNVVLQKTRCSTDILFLAGLFFSVSFSWLFCPKRPWATVK